MNDPIIIRSATGVEIDARLVELAIYPLPRPAIVARMVNADGSHDPDVAQRLVGTLADVLAYAMTPTIAAEPTQAPDVATDADRPGDGHTAPVPATLGDLIARIAKGWSK